MAANEHSVRLAVHAARALANKKGIDVILLDVSRHLVITDVFVIATGTSNRHVRTLIDETEDVVREHEERRPLRREGIEDAKWILLDYGDVVIHVFDTETRAYYDLERLWGDAPRLHSGSMAAEA